MCRLVWPEAERMSFVLGVSAPRRAAVRPWDAAGFGQFGLGVLFASLAV
jgi:hypothetical protein